MRSEHAIARPTLMITFDTELGWGSFPAPPSQVEKEAVRATRDTVMPALLSMLDELRIPATFALVGHLLCRPGDYTGPAIAHGDPPEVSDWYGAIPKRWREFPEGYYWPEVVDMILSSRMRHEIGLHSFSHWYFPAAQTNDRIVEFELSQNLRVLADSGAPQARSMVFPRNGVGGLEALAASGVRSYRSPQRPWHARLPGTLARRTGHLVDAALGFAPPVAPSVRQVLPGLWEIPGSLVFMSAAGVRRVIPTAGRVRQMVKGAERAAREPGLFHLWTHPINLGTAPLRLLDAFRQGLEGAMAAWQGMEAVTMSQVVAEAQAPVLVGGDDR